MTIYDGRRCVCRGRRPTYWLQDHHGERWIRVCADCMVRKVVAALDRDHERALRDEGRRAR